MRHLLLAAVLALPASAHAQIRASEAASVSQTIDGTKITVEYSRPRVRGRQPLWGTPAVQWGEIWTPGANWATTLDVSRDVKLDGHPVPKGKYSVWLVVRERGDWTLSLHPKARAFHMAHLDTMGAAVRFPVTVTEAPFTETLTWSFPDVRVDGGTLAMQWERKRVALDVRVEPSLTVTLAEAEAKPYLGRWETTGASGPDSGKTKGFEVYYENGTLKGNFDPKDEYFRDFALIRLAPDAFTIGLYDKGEVYEVLRPDLVLTFTRVDGVPRTFEMRGGKDQLYATGKRKDGVAARE